MITRLGFIVVTLFCLPLNAFASTIINIEYTGHISSLYGEDLGYRLGDLVSGTVKIDVSKIETTYENTAKSLDGYAMASKKGLLRSSNYSGADVGNNTIDMISVYDDIYITNPGSLSNSSGYYQDGLGADEVLSLQGSTLNFFQIRIKSKLDWINWLKKEVNLETSDPDLLMDSGGVFGRMDIDSFLILDLAGFELDSVKVHSTNVPESSSLLFAMIGFLGLALKRR